MSGACAESQFIAYSTAAQRLYIIKEVIPMNERMEQIKAVLADEAFVKACAEAAEGA